MFGVDEFVAIINPPEAAILAVGAIKDVPGIEDGRIVPGKVMRMTLSVDHRVFYGATAAQFMAEVKRLIENPVTLLVPAPGRPARSPASPRAQARLIPAFFVPCPTKSRRGGRGPRGGA